MRVKKQVPEKRKTSQVDRPEERKTLQIDRKRLDVVRLAALARVANAGVELVKDAAGATRAELVNEEQLANAVSWLYCAMNAPRPDWSILRDNHEELLGWLRLRPFDPASLAVAQRQLRAWFEAVRSHRGRGLPDIIEQVEQGLTEADVSTRFEFNSSERRFELTLRTSHDKVSPSALVALAALPIFDETAEWRSRLKRCDFRKCREYFFVFGKNAKKKYSYCRESHSNHERQLRNPFDPKRKGI